VQDDGQLADGHDARAICIVLSNVSYVEDAAKLARKTSARAQLVRKLRTLFAVRPSWPFFMSPRDIGLFVRSARTDRAIGRMRRQFAALVTMGRSVGDAGKAAFDGLPTLPRSRGQGITAASAGSMERRKARKRGRPWRPFVNGKGRRVASQRGRLSARSRPPGSRWRSGA
jgi:hypothetical protein